MPGPSGSDDDAGSKSAGPSSSQPPGTGDSAAPAGPPRIYQSDELFRGQREIWIEHGDVLYRLRTTSTGKLILTK
jgi:hemin uptake protein HemP